LVFATLVYSMLILIVSLVVAIASWHLYEKHFMALKQRLAPRSVQAAQG